MTNFISFFVPRDKKFFPLLERATDNLHATARVLVAMVNAPNPEKRNEFIKEIERLEHVGDNITHEIFNELSANFITPFDREDIHSLVSAIDDVVDLVHGSAKRIDLYRIKEIPRNVVKLAELVLDGAEELHGAVAALRDMKNADKIRAACVRINRIENHADDIFDMSIAALFEEEKDAIQVIKMKEVYSALETATDMCEDAANAISNIVIKYA